MPGTLDRSARSACFVMLLVAVLATVFYARPALAQEAPAEGAAAAPDAAGAPAASEPVKQQSWLGWLIHTSGTIGLFLLIISIYFVSKVVQLFMSFRMEVSAPPELVQECEALLAKKDYNGIYQAAKASDSDYGVLVSSGLSVMAGGMDDVRDTLDRVGEAMNVNMEKQISMLAVIGSLGPMIGLLGTLKGMIASFSVIAMSETSLKASQVAEGISEALVLTFEGVILSVPAIYFFALFKNKGATISVEVQNMAEAFLRKLHTTAQRGAAPAPAPAAPAK